ncbi:MAG: L,D-transpeptidase [Cyanobacteriota bacterium]
MAVPMAVPMAVAAAAAMAVPMAVGAAFGAPTQSRAAEPLPPLAPLSPAGESLPQRLPPPLRQQQGLELVLDRRQRLLMVLEGGQLLRRYPAAVGMVGWETPVGRFQVLEMRTDPVWEHPGNGRLVGPGAANPLGSRWIGFHRDCTPRTGWDGERHLSVRGCTVTGFHGTPQRWTVGRAVSHGCVRLHEEDVRELFAVVQLGTPVTVLP